MEESAGTLMLQGSSGKSVVQCFTPLKRTTFITHGLRILDTGLNLDSVFTLETGLNLDTGLNLELLGYAHISVRYIQLNLARHSHVMRMVNSVVARFNHVLYCTVVRRLNCFPQLTVMSKGKQEMVQVQHSDRDGIILVHESTSHSFRAQSRHVMLHLSQPIHTAKTLTIQTPMGTPHP